MASGSSVIYPSSTARSVKFGSRIGKAFHVANFTDS
jgi:hypothetical protein